MLLYRNAEGGWCLAELQINVAAFVRLKGRAGGGHDIFNFARALMAYDPSVYNYRGDCDEAACEKAGAGLLIGCEFEGGCKTAERAARLGAGEGDVPGRGAQLEGQHARLGGGGAGGD